MAVATSTILAAGAVGLGAASAIGQARAGSMQAKALKQQGDWNAQVYEQQAEMVKKKQELQETQDNRMIARMRSTGIARTAGAGLQLSGSPLALLIENETQMELDKSISMYNSEVQRRYLLSGSDYSRVDSSNQARLAKYQGYTNAFSTALNTGTSAYMIGRL